MTGGESKSSKEAISYCGITNSGSIQGNVIKNCPVTPADVDIAEKIYGQAISTLKGKTTRKTPKAMVTDEVLIPQELLTKHQQLELRMDMMFVNKQPFLTSIDKSV